jgi:aryl-alcohol dehydrogenase-like predicted oxidoreductase
VKQNRLGNSEIAVSEICLGSMTWGQQNSQLEAFEQLDYAVSNGVNFIDTAEMYSIPTNKDTYGSTETIIGNWLNSRKSRENIVLATKVAGLGHWIPHIRGGNTQFNRNHIESAVNGCLKRLQTDYIDIYQLHWPDRNTNCFGRLGYSHNENEPAHHIEETLEALTYLVKKGKIRHVGLSNESAWGAMRFLDLVAPKRWQPPRNMSL